MERRRKNPLEPETFERVVSVQCYWRSGSTFLASLLDSHPQVLTTPGVQLASYFHFWDRYCQGRPALIVLGAFLQTFQALYKFHFTGGAPIWTPIPPSDGSKSPVDEQRFKDVLLMLVQRVAPDVRTQPVSRKYFFQAVHIAYAVAQGRQVDWENALIVYPLHEPLTRWAQLLLEDFPQARFLHAVRRPLDSWGSWFHGLAQGIDKNPFELDLARYGIMAMLTQTRPIFEACRERSRAVRLEDLRTAPRETMQQVSAWLGLRWDDCLVASTFNGIEFQQGSNSGGTRVGFTNRGGPQQAEKRFPIFSRLDFVRLRAITAHACAAWDYEQPAAYRWSMVGALTEIAAWLPFRVERRLWKLCSGQNRFAKLGKWLDRYIALRRELRAYRTEGRHAMPVLRPVEAAPAAPVAAIPASAASLAA